MELIELRAMTKRAATARERAERAQQELNEAIRAALKDERIKTKQIVEITGLTRSRIYQIRDNSR